MYSILTAGFHKLSKLCISNNPPVPAPYILPAGPLTVSTENKLLKANWLK